MMLPHKYSNILHRSQDMFFVLPSEEPAVRESEYNYYFNYGETHCEYSDMFKGHFFQRTDFLYIVNESDAVCNLAFLKEGVPAKVVIDEINRQFIKTYEDNNGDFSTVTGEGFGNESKPYPPFVIRYGIWHMLEVDAYYYYYYHVRRIASLLYTDKIELAPALPFFGLKYFRNLLL